MRAVDNVNEVLLTECWKQKAKGERRGNGNF